METTSAMKNLKSGLTSGLLAAAIYLLVVALLPGMDVNADSFTAALIVGGMTFALAFLIGIVISATKRSPS